MSTLQIISISIFALLGVLLSLGTGIDFVQLRRREQGRKVDSVQERSRLVDLLMCFSVLANGKKLLTIRESKDSLTVLHGMRFFATAHIVLGHCYAFTFMIIMGNTFDMFKTNEGAYSQVVKNAIMSVDTFFFLSGLLVTYVTMCELKKRDRITWKFIPSFYFHRFWRLTPPIFFVILFVFVWPLLGSGPLWDASTIARSGRCQLYGWATLLYVQNFIAQEAMCMEHLWYLAVDMQLYLLSPIILISLHRNRSWGLVVNTLFLLGSVLTTFLIGYINDIVPHVIYHRHMDVKKVVQLEFLVNQRPWCRLGPFCIGIFLGYILNCRKEFNIPKWAVCLGWCLSTACNTAVMFGIQPWTTGHMPSKWVGSLYLATSGTAWSLGLAWTVFACVTGHGGIVRRFLSMKLLVPLSRISYMIYLIHPLFIHSFLGLLRDRMIYTHFLQVVLYLGFLSMSIGVAFVASLAVEAPFIALEKVLFRRAQTESKQENIPLRDEYKKLLHSEDPIPDLHEESD